MARSLTITPEDNPTTSPLLTGFLVIGVGVLLLTTLVGAASVTGEAPADAAPIVAD